MIKGYFIKYNFILPDEIEHSSYTYQKLFRAIYGYTQNVTKSNGKIYRYHRKGVLSGTPYIKAGKNSVIIPPKSFGSLDTFFKTGKNPTHFWRVKGDWKATFYMDEKDLDEGKVIAAIKEHISRTFQNTLDDVVVPDLAIVIEKNQAGEQVPKEKTEAALIEAEKIINSQWFKDVYSKDQVLRKFNDDYRILKG